MRLLLVLNGALAGVSLWLGVLLWCELRARGRLIDDATRWASFLLDLARQMQSERDAARAEAASWRQQFYAVLPRDEHGWTHLERDTPAD